MKDVNGVSLNIVDFLTRDFGSYHFEVCTSNFTEHRVCFTVEQDDEVLVDEVLDDEQIDVLIQALESAKDLRTVRIENNEPIYREDVK